MKLSSLQDLFVEELKDLYDAEKRILEALPKMAKTAESEDLANGFTEHLEQTRTHVYRLEQIFRQLGKPVRGKKCEAMEGLLEEGKEIMEEDADPTVKDAALIAAAQRVEHYEIAGYGCVRTWAQLLGHDSAANLLQETLDEEKATDEKLTELAKGINVAANEESEEQGTEGDGASFSAESQTEEETDEELEDEKQSHAASARS